nr:hypothetical protein [Tanacetum cinerariifolium]
PRPLENFQSNTIVETLPTSHIPLEDSDFQREEIDIFTGTDELLPSSIESNDYDLEGEIHFPKELLVNDSISLPEIDPPPEPPDVEFDFEPNSGEDLSPQ